MSMIYDTIKEINEKLLSSEFDIVECLKKTRYVAKYYNDTTPFSWIKNELKGYEKFEDLPKYRVTREERIYRREISEILQ
ncbi:hypothetical protein LCGC14_2149690 [marine sediment metagenome]|uniref:AbiTii domain-containing protein n=1 Tax=marine sediment metagenome TaxID=412755 RepID=A0A0F9DW26_9ZZZZ